MRLLIQLEIVALILLPFILGFLWRRGAVNAKRVSLIIAIAVSLFSGSYYLFLGNPRTFSSITLEDWAVAIGVALLSWLSVYATLRLLSKR